MIRSAYNDGLVQACVDAGLMKIAFSGKFSLPLALVGSVYGVHNLGSAAEREKRRRKKQTVEEMLQKVHRGY